MITLENRFFPLRSAACFLIEGAIVFFSVIVSFLILQKMHAVEVIGLHDAMARGLVVAFFCQSCMYCLDLYDFKHSHSRGELFFSLIFSVGVACVGIGLISYVLPEFGVEGKLYYLTILILAFVLLVWRVAFDFYLTRVAPAENILIVGTGQTAKMVAEEIKARERLGFKLIGFVKSTPAGEEVPPLLGNVLGDYSQMESIVGKFGVRKIVVAINERRGMYPVREMLKMRVRGCDIVEWPGFFERLAGRIPIDNLAPSYIIFNQGFRKSLFVRLVRRVLSAVIAAGALVVMAPVLVIVAVAIKLDSPGPVFYSQKRVGQNGKVFRIYKFRSMRIDAEGGGVPRWAIKNDPRVTRIGRILRRSRLDELPQMLNILRGDIDLVGPRPERPEFVAELEKIIPYYALRHTIKPGLTGWAQVMFPYCGTIEESKKKVQYDLFYIKNMSVKLDLLILFRTIKIVVLGRGAR